MWCEIRRSWTYITPGLFISTSAFPKTTSMSLTVSPLNPANDIDKHRHTTGRIHPSTRRSLRAPSVRRHRRLGARHPHPHALSANAITPCGHPHRTRQFVAIALLRDHRARDTPRQHALGEAKGSGGAEMGCVDAPDATADAERVPIHDCAGGVEGQV